MLFLCQKRKRMVTNELIKSEFISSILSRDVKRIYRTQANVVNSLNVRTGKLSDYISRRPFTISGPALNKRLYFPVLSYLRFLDIHYSNPDTALRRNLALYNRVIWGVIYNETYPDIRFGFTSQLREIMRRDLELAGGESSDALRVKWINELS